MVAKTVGLEKKLVLQRVPHLGPPSLRSCVYCAGLSIRLYHPNAPPTGLSSPGRQMRVCTASPVGLLPGGPDLLHAGQHSEQRSYGALSAAADTCVLWQCGLMHGRVRTVRRMQSYVAEDGCLHIVADKHRIQDAVASLDLGRAQLLTRLSLFWIQRVRCDPGPSHCHHDAQPLECQQH